MRTAIYKKWLYERQFTLPDEEEKKLKQVVSRSRHNNLVKEIQEKSLKPVDPEEEDDLDGNYGPPPPVPKENTTTAATVGVKTLLAHRNLYFNADGSRKRLSFNFLPMFLRERVFTFLPVIHQSFLDDLATMERMLLVSDSEILRDAELADEITQRVQSEILGLHSKEYGEFALTAQSMGITGVPVSRLGNPVYTNYGADLRRTLALARCLSARQAQFRQWTEFRESTLETTCYALRSTLRNDLVMWRGLLNDWKVENVPPSSVATPEGDDVISATAFDELNALESRIGGIEFLGSEELQLDDVRNMCFELDLPMPDMSGKEGGMTEDYTKSLTVAQSITLGFVDIPWVKGYSWEDRAAVLEKEEVEAASSRSRAQSTGTGVSSEGEAAAANRRKALIQAASARQQRAMEQSAQEEREAKEQEEAAAAATALREKQDRQRAAAVAADSMTQRIWISSEQYQQRWQHRFGGCEYCASLPIHHVGLKLKTSAVTSDIALCNGCYNDLYSDESSVAHRMYQWYVVSDLVGKMAPVDIVPLAAKPPLSEMAQELSKLQQRDEDEAEAEAEEARREAEELEEEHRIQLNLAEEVRKEKLRAEQEAAGEHPVGDLD